jgi:hypothetical protein
MSVRSFPTQRGDTENLTKFTKTSGKLMGLIKLLNWIKKTLKFETDVTMLIESVPTEKQLNENREIGIKSTGSFWEDFRKTLIFVLNERLVCH